MAWPGTGRGGGVREASVLEALSNGLTGKRERRSKNRNAIYFLCILSFSLPERGEES